MARKIADDWLKKAKKYKSDFDGMYPGPSETLKAFMEIERDFNNGNLSKLNVTSKRFLGVKEFLKNVQKYNVKHYKEFEIWCKNEPEKGMIFIDKKVKIGKRTDKYKEIEADLKKTFDNIQKELKSSRKIWVKYYDQIVKNMIAKMKMFEKILKR